MRLTLALGCALALALPLASCAKESIGGDSLADGPEPGYVPGSGGERSAEAEEPAPDEPQIDAAALILDEDGPLQAGYMDDTHLDDGDAP